MKKKLVLILLGLIATMSLAGCSGCSNNDQAKSNDEEIVTEANDNILLVEDTESTDENSDTITSNIELNKEKENKSEGNNIDYSLNAYANNAKMPNLVGLNVSAAMKVLANYSLDLSDVVYEVSSEKEGTIIKQSPSNNSEIKENDKVVLYVAKSSDSKTKVPMPDITGMPTTKAIELLEKLELNYKDLTNGIVKYQSYQYNNMIPVGTVVTLK